MTDTGTVTSRDVSTPTGKDSERMGLKVPPEVIAREGAGGEDDHRYIRFGESFYPLQGMHNNLQWRM